MAITITTGDIKEPYEIMDAIFALDFHKEGFLTGAKPEQAFDNVKTKLSDNTRVIITTPTHD